MKTNKRNFLIAPGLATMAAALLSALSAAAEIVITAPKEGETVCQLFPAQLKFATESQAERDKYFDGAEHAKALNAKIKELAPQAEIRIQQTWSYSPYSGRLADWKMDAASMDKAVRNAYAGLVKTYGLKLIPTGEAVALYRERLPVSYVKVLTADERARLKPPEKIEFYGDVTGASSRKKDGTLRIDPHHLNDEGKYLQACVWLAALFDVDVTRLTYEPAIRGFSKKACLMRQCAADAVSRNKI